MGMDIPKRFPDSSSGQFPRTSPKQFYSNTHRTISLNISASGTIFLGTDPLNLHFWQLNVTARGLLVFQSRLGASKTVKHYTLDGSKTSSIIMCSRNN